MQELQLELYHLQISVLTNSLQRSKGTHFKYEHQMFFFLGVLTYGSSRLLAKYNENFIY